MAIATPAFIGLGRGVGMRGAVNSISSTLSLLRQWAITHREEVTFYYFAAATPSASYYYAVSAGGIPIISTNVNDSYNGSPQLPLDVKFYRDSTIIFKTDGGLKSPGDQEIIIVDRKTPSQKKTISINGLTGGIRIE